MSQEQNGIVEAESTSLIPTTDVQQRIETMIANRAHIVEKVKPLLIEGVDVYKLPGMTKESLGKPGAEKLAAIFGLTGKFEVDKETMEAIGATANGKQYIAYVCNLSRAGRVAGQGRGATFIEWMRNSYQMVFEKPAGTAEKDGWKGPFQGKSKQTGKPYTFWKVPETPVFDPLALNKAIKMAQKSAFVDAVIRASGMSDLFTQDLEDMPRDDAPEAPQATTTAPNAKDEPFPDQEPQNAPQAAETVPTCDLCGQPMKKRTGPRGPFWGCSGWPTCKNIKPV